MKFIAAFLILITSVQVVTAQTKKALPFQNNPSYFITIYCNTTLITMPLKQLHIMKEL
jgi:hypothetical protein